jgi:hypothetical protein
LFAHTITLNYTVNLNMPVLVIFELLLIKSAPDFYLLSSSEKRLDSDGSKDSSIDSGTELRHYGDFHRETAITTKQVHIYLLFKYRGTISIVLH